MQLDSGKRGKISQHDFQESLWRSGYYLKDEIIKD